MMNKYWSFVSTYLIVIIILYVGYIPTTAATVIGDTCGSDEIEETTRVTVNVKGKKWVPGGPKISVEIVTEGSPIKNIEVWAEPINKRTHIGSWSPITGHEYVDGCGHTNATITNEDELNLSQITYEWNPPSVKGQKTPTQETPNQETPTQESSNQETPTQETSNQETPTQESSNQETPTQDYPYNEPSSPTTAVDSADYQDEYVLTIESATLTLKVSPTGSSFIARQEPIKNSTSLDGSIVFKGVLQFEDSSFGEIYSFKSDNIPMFNVATFPTFNGTTSNHNIPTSNGTTLNNGKIPENNHITNIDNKYPENSPFSATNSKFIFKGFNLFFILTLSGGFLGYF